MTRLLSKSITFITALACLVVFNPAPASGFVSIEISPEAAEIKSSIKYTVVGKYIAEFDEYNGNIEINMEDEDIRSVILNIDAASIRSNCGWCDNIVRSKQLLHVDQYPQIIFRSDKIIKDSEGYQVKGILDLHGEQRELSFPFKLSRAEGRLVAEGQWIIERKEFNIIWNRFLDKGGVLVGNTITVDWKINLPMLN